MWTGLISEASATDSPRENPPTNLVYDILYIALHAFLIKKNVLIPYLLMWYSSGIFLRRPVKLIGDILKTYT